MKIILPILAGTAAAAVILAASSALVLGGRSTPVAAFATVEDSPLLGANDPAPTCGPEIAPAIPEPPVCSLPLP